MKCPICNAEMRSLAISVYCPNDCDRRNTKSPIHILKCRELTYQVAKIEIGESIPIWAERGWHLDNANRLSMSSYSLDHLVKEWQYYCTATKEKPGWVRSWRRSPTSINNYSTSLLVFGVIKGD